MKSVRFLLYSLYSISIIPAIIALIIWSFRIEILIPVFLMIRDNLIILAIPLLGSIGISALSHLNSKKVVELFDKSLDNWINREHENYLIIIAKSRSLFHPLWYSGIDLLIFKLERKNKNYFIFEAQTEESARNLICNPTFSHIFIFGHGKRDRLGFYFGNRKFTLEYSKLKSCEKKEYIAQLHCNSGNGESLIDILVKEGKKINSFIIDGIRTPPENWFDLLFFIHI